LTEDEYINIRELSTNAWLRGFTGFGCSYSGKWWGGYCRDGTGRNYCQGARNSTLRKMKGLLGVQFTCGSYHQVAIPSQSLIYCDIPYKNTTQYSVGPFDHSGFYQWSTNMANDGHLVIVSEYKHNLQKGWEIVWECDSRKSIRTKKQQETIEILMTPK
jgi:DNA adenine methylase